MNEPCQLELFAHDALDAIDRRLPRGDWVTVSDVASAFNYSVTVVYSWMDEGLVVVFRGTDNGSHKIFRPSVMAFARKRLGIVEKQKKEE